MDFQTTLPCGQILQYGFDSYACKFRGNGISGFIKKDYSFSYQYSGSATNADLIPTLVKEALEFIISECRKIRFLR